MLSQKDFVSFIKAIKKEEKRLYNIAKNIEYFGDGFIVVDNPLIESIIEFLKKAMNDKGDYIEWWLFEEVDKKVWLRDGTEIDVSTPQKLYKFLKKDIENEAS